MAEPISALAATETAKTASISVSKEVLAETLKESVETFVKQSPVQSMMDTIENTSLESLKAQNEFDLDTIKESKINQIDLNRENGALRQENAMNDLLKEYPESEGFNLYAEAYLRNEQANIVKDSITGEARRVDFMVEKEAKIIKSVEVTSETAPKEIQLAKEERIRNNGGNFILDRDTGKLVEVPKEVKTEIRRYA